MRSFLRVILFAALLTALFAAPANAYLMPDVRMTAAETATPAEETLARCQAELDAIRARVPATALGEHGRASRRGHLSAEQRRIAASYEKAQETFAFWKYVADLKRDLIALQADPADPVAIAEADAIAKIAIQRIYELSREYRIVGSALINNFLVNRGVKEKGFCYQYVSQIRGALRQRGWQRYELRWGEAWAGEFRENNALVITAAGAPFERGIAVDVWRSASKPFWTPVSGDRFPWKEAFNIEIDDSKEVKGSVISDR